VHTGQHYGDDMSNIFSTRNCFGTNVPHY
jgi:hypothetical protein